MLKKEFKDKLKMEAKRDVTNRLAYLIQKSHSLSHLGEEDTRDLYKRFSKKSLYEIYEQFKSYIVEDETISNDTKIKILESDVLKDLIDNHTLDITYNTGNKENSVFLPAIFVLFVLNFGGLVFEVVPYFRTLRSVAYVDLLLIPVFIYLIFKFKERNLNIASLEIRLAQIEFNEWLDRVDNYLDEVLMNIKMGILNEVK